MQAFAHTPVITLTTDFGVADHYVGTMKGVILSRCPGALVVDITHEIPPFSILAAAYATAQAAPYFPAGTIHVVVVDPGVGTERKGIAAAANGQVFIAPDNGVLSLVLGGEAESQSYELANKDLWLTRISTTFHGRDIFSAVAGKLASGQAQLSDVGPPLPKPVRLDALYPVEVSPGVWHGRILSVDRFGNVITNLAARQFPGLAELPFSIRIRETTIGNMQKTFGSAARGAPFAYFGSSGFVELALNQEALAARFEIAIGDCVVLDVSESGPSRATIL